jgi:hypothetical protein
VINILGHCFYFWSVFYLADQSGFSLETVLIGLAVVVFLKELFNIDTEDARKNNL